ncbi:MAG TPA: methyltransferase domain-containing protein [Vicinamibacteria bacterium]
MAGRAPSYLEPYSRARRQKAKGARALLWVGRRDQIVRFEAIVRACPLAGRRVLDVGCGPGDLLGFLRRRGILPAHYVGLEAQPWLVRAARRRDYERSTIVEGDFVKDPQTLRVGAEVVIFSGSLNLLSSRQFYRSLGDAWAATHDWLVFNFLCTPDLAGARWLHWHRRATVLAFARRLRALVHMDDRYEPGDCLAVLRKRRSARGAPVIPP